jgi:hypothetical protein
MILPTTNRRDFFFLFEKPFFLPGKQSRKVIAQPWGEKAVFGYFTVHRTAK